MSLYGIIVPSKNGRDIVKYVIVDLDDTLLTKDKRVSNYTMEGIKELKKKGFIFVINTARSLDSASKYIDITEADYSILNGGAIIVDKNKKIIYKKLIDKDTVNYVLNKIKEKNVKDYSIEGESGLYTPNLEYANYNPLATYFDFKDGFFEASYKILISDTDLSYWKELANSIHLEFEKYLNGVWSRISPSSKYMGNLELFKILKDDHPMDFVFGDDFGDIEMIKNAYHGVILKNARDCLKAGIKNVTEYDMDNDGVMKYLLNLGL